MSTNLLAETLRKIRFLHDLAPEHLELIANHTRIQDFNEGNVVFREGDAAESIYLVIYGNVSLEICAAGSGCKQILTIGSGELLGWSALLGQSRYTARARTLESTRLVEINVPRLMLVCDRDPKFGYELMRRTALALANRLSATRMQLIDAYGIQLPTVTA